MKVEVNSESKVFEPITLTITLETRDELLDMWARTALRNDRLVANVERYQDRVVSAVGENVIVKAVNRSPNNVSGNPLLSVLEKEILRGKNPTA
jgi:hypothetical protein